MVTVQEISQFTSNPLLLLVVGAAITSYIIPKITNRWQEQRKEIEVKIELTTKMSTLIGDLFGNAAKAWSSESGLTQDQIKEALSFIEKWTRKTYATRHQLQAYTRSSKLSKQWDWYINILRFYLFASLGYFDKSPNSKQSLENSLNDLKEYLKNSDQHLEAPINTQINIDIDTITSASYNQKAWMSLGTFLTEIGDETLQEVMNTSFKGLKGGRSWW